MTLMVIVVQSSFWPWFYRSGFIKIFPTSGYFMYQLIYFYFFFLAYGNLCFIWFLMLHLLYFTCKVRKPLTLSCPSFTKIKYAQHSGNQNWKKGKSRKDGTSERQRASGCQSLLSSFTWVLRLVRLDGDRGFCSYICIENRCQLGGSNWLLGYACNTFRNSCWLIAVNLGKRKEWL